MSFLVKFWNYFGYIIVAGLGCILITFFYGLFLSISDKWKKKKKTSAYIPQNDATGNSIDDTEDSESGEAMDVEQKETDFTIIQVPVEIKFICPHCGSDIRINWTDVKEIESLIKMARQNCEEQNA